MEREEREELQEKIDSIKERQKNEIITSISFGITIFTFVALIILFKGDLGTGFFKKFIALIVMFIASFFIGHIAIGVPIFISHYLITNTFEDFCLISKKKQFLIVLILAIIVCAILALFK